MKSGTNTGSVERSREAKRRRRAARKRQEKRWAAKSGPVTVTYVDPNDPDSFARWHAQAKPGDLFIEPGED